MAYGPWEMVWHAVMDKPSPVAPFLLAPLLFAGPIYSDWILDQPSVGSMWKALMSLQGIRNWVVVSFERERFRIWVETFFLLELILGLECRRFVQAPLTEEIVFRSCMIACAQLAGASVKHQIFITPLWFGLGESSLSLSLLRSLSPSSSRY